MTDRIRVLTAIEELAIRQAGELRQTLECLKADPPGSQADRECIIDALDSLTGLQRCLDDLAGPDNTCPRCGTEIPAGDVWCSKCQPR